MHVRNKFPGLRLFEEVIYNQEVYFEHEVKNYLRSITLVVNRPVATGSIRRQCPH